MSLDEAEAGIRRALRSVDWEELPSDRYEYDVPLTGGGRRKEGSSFLLEAIPFTRRWLRRALKRSIQAPPRRFKSDDELFGRHRGSVVRISLVDRAAFGTEVTIVDGKSPIGELRRSIEIQGGSLTPHQPAAR